MSLKLDQPEKVVENLLNQYSVSAQFKIFLKNCALEIQSNSTALIEQLKEYYDLFLQPTEEPTHHIVIYVFEGESPQFDCQFQIKTPDPGKTKIKEAYAILRHGRIVHKLLTGMMLIFDQSFHLAIGPCLKNSNQVVNFINNRYMEWRLNQGCILMHASGVVVKNKGIAITGFSGKGKSTLALHLMSQGAQFVSNDRLMVQRLENRLMMYGIPKLPRINPGTIIHNVDLRHMISAPRYQQLQNMEYEDLWAIEEKYDVNINEIFGQDRFVLATPLKVMIVLNWTKEKNKFECKKIDLRKRPDLLAVIRKDPGLFFVPQREDYFMKFSLAEAYLEHLKYCQIYELTGEADFYKAVDVCQKMLGK